MLEVGLVDRVGEARRVVDHERAGGHRELSEQHAGRDCPGSLRHVVGGIVAHDEHVEVGDRDLLAAVLGVLNAFEVRRLVGAAFLGGGAGVGRDGAVGTVREFVDADQPSVVPALGCDEREANGRVLGFLGRDAVDDKADSHEASPMSEVSEATWRSVSSRVVCAAGDRGSAG